jgi:TRL-like protein family
MLRSLLAGASLAPLLTGCIFSDVRAPLSYGSATPSDANGSLGREVTGSACNSAVLWLVAWGDGGYDAAVRDARRANNAPFLVDVKADTAYTNVLFGIYQHQCTTVTARLPVVASAPAPGGATP